jgi:hypothetical protein
MPMTPEQLDLAVAVQRCLYVLMTSWLNFRASLEAHIRKLTRRFYDPIFGLRASRVVCQRCYTHRVCRRCP